MNEMENLRIDLSRADVVRTLALDQFIRRMDEALMDFKKTLDTAREIERQAGIGSDINA